MSVHDRYRDYREDQREFFDALITEELPSYESADWDATRRYEVELLFKVVRPATILDVGCGIGFHDVEMANYPFVSRVDAIDNSAASIEAANKLYPHPNVQRWVAGFMDLPASQGYDLVASFQVFEHLSNPNSYLAKMKELVRPGGSIAIIMPNKARWPNFMRTLKNLPPEVIDVMHFREYTAREIVALARSHGFIKQRVFGYGLYGRRKRLTQRQRLILGRLLPQIAFGLVAVFRTQAETK